MRKIIQGVLLVIVLGTIPMIASALEAELPTIEELAASVKNLLGRIEALEARVGEIETMMPPVGVGTPAPQPTAVAPTPCYTFPRVSAQEIINDYNDERVNADGKYKDVLLEVSGQIARVRKDDRYYIIFNIRGGPDNVRCNLAPGQVHKWTRLKEGDLIIVFGAGAGKNAGPWGDFNLNACTIVE